MYWLFKTEPIGLIASRDNILSGILLRLVIAVIVVGIARHSHMYTLPLSTQLLLAGSVYLFLVLLFYRGVFLLRGDEVATYYGASDLKKVERFFWSCAWGIFPLGILLFHALLL